MCFIFFLLAKNSLDSLLFDAQTNSIGCCDFQSSNQPVYDRSVFLYQELPPIKDAAVLISNVLKPMYLIRAELYQSKQGMIGCVTPSLIVKSSSLVQMFKERLILWTTKNVKCCNLKIRPKTR